jgi:DNA (cytosine-5)-methyltransferase 1
LSVDFAMTIKIVDLFAGPGGLGEGFSMLSDGEAFKILVSAEMESTAHSTLRLRSFFRLIRHDKRALSRYYEFCNNPNVDKAYDEHSNAAWDKAGKEARQLKLGDPSDNKVLDDILDEMLRPDDKWVLIGGPPCQAYSLVGRNRNSGTLTYRPEDDHRFFLYREYFRIVQERRPPIFVMENVEGILSAKVGGEKIFPKILRELSAPGSSADSTGDRLGYRIHSLVSETVFEHGMNVDSIDLRNFIVKTDELGIPQARNRVILLGVRTDIEAKYDRLSALPNADLVHVEDVIGDLPPLRSTLTKEEDSASKWSATVKKELTALARDARRLGKDLLANHLAAAAADVRQDLTSGALRYPRDVGTSPMTKMADWYLDPNLSVWLNHDARGHMASDLRRYGYAATYAEVFQRSPKGHAQFDLAGLAPSHKNWKSGKFTDRFHVQRRGAPSRTVTSHISKDGHSFIHYDPTQCRSLTVREAARLQTFPDNYFFQGNRTEQFHQVGNAVPPRLGNMIAKIVRNILEPVSAGVTADPGFDVKISPAGISSSDCRSTHLTCSGATDGVPHL